MFHRFRWTGVSTRRNAVMAEFEPVQPFFLLALAEAAGCRTFVDVGANVGAYSLFATQIPSVERWIAFEANPHAAAELRANIALNNLHIEVREEAVSNKSGSLAFGLVSNYAGTNAVKSTAIAHPARGAFRDEITVPAVALDSILPLQAPFCLKIDVEGHEPQVIAGAGRFLQSPCVVQIEEYNGCEISLPGHTKLTSIGPDHYFSNIPGLQTLPAYEHAMRLLIQSNHRSKSVTIGRGDFSLQVSGKSGAVARSLARKVLGKRL
jgi:FkbM family methyltransferase